MHRQSEMANSSSYSNAGLPSLRTLRPCGGSSVFVVLILRVNWHDGSKQKIPVMFPGCFHGKEKD